MKFCANVTVTLKDGIRDVQGSAIDTVLKRLKVEDEPDVKVGKFFALQLTAEDETSAREKLKHICNEVLSNPILEKYKIEKFEQIS